MATGKHTGSGFERESRESKRETRGAERREDGPEPGDDPRDG
jgi:hypothetical protein